MKTQHSQAPRMMAITAVELILLGILGGTIGALLMWGATL